MRTVLFIINDIYEVYMTGIQLKASIFLEFIDYRKEVNKKFAWDESAFNKYWSKIITILNNIMNEKKYSAADLRMVNEYVNDVDVDSYSDWLKYKRI